MACRHLPILLLGALAACAETPPHESQATSNFGLAVRSNMEAQIIAKEDEVRALAPAPGDRRALAVDRYQTDQVEQPAKVYTNGE